MDNYPQGEVREMVALYTARGLDPHDALAAVTILSKKKDFFIDLMMLEELEIAPYRGLPPFLGGFVLFCFVLFCFVLFCFVLFCFVLFCFVLFCFVLFCFVCLFICLFI